MPNKINSPRRPWEGKKLGKQEGRQVDNSAFYNSAIWRSTRRQFLNVHPLCVSCKLKGITRLAKVVDHEPRLVELKKMGLDPCDWKYLNGQCDSCHNSKSGKERHGIKS